MAQGTMWPVKVLTGNKDRFIARICDEKLVENVKNILGSTEKLRAAEEELSEGQHIVVEYLHYFHRAKVISLQGSRLLCCLIDNAIKVIIDIECAFKVLSNELFDIPPVVLNCRISNVDSFPSDSFDKIVFEETSTFHLELHLKLANDDYDVSLHRIKDDILISIYDMIQFANGNYPEICKILKLMEYNPEEYLQAIIERSDENEESLFVMINGQNEDIDEIYSREPCSPPPPVTVGSVVIAPWEGKLFRAQVLEVLADACLYVEFVDYGNQDTVSWWDCHQIYSNLLYPRLCFVLDAPAKFDNLENDIYVCVKEDQDGTNVTFFKEVDGRKVSLIEETSLFEAESNTSGNKELLDLEPQFSSEYNADISSESCSQNIDEDFEFDKDKLDKNCRKKSKRILEDTIKKSDTNDSNTVYRVCLENPFITVSKKELLLWAQKNFGPIRCVHVTEDVLKFDFCERDGQEKCADLKKVIFNQIKMKVLDRKTFVRDDYDLSIFVSDYEKLSEKDIRKYCEKFGKVSFVRMYEGCCIVKFSDNELRDQIVVNENHTIKNQSVSIRKYGDRKNNSNKRSIEDKAKNLPKNSKTAVAQNTHSNHDRKSDQSEDRPIRPVVVVEEKTKMNITEISSIAKKQYTGSFFVNLTHIENPDKIWLVESESDFKTCDKLCQLFGTRSQYQDSEIRIGSYYIGEIPDIDGRWYRIQIMEHNDSDLFTVFTIDTGHTVVIPKTKIKVMPTQLVDTPRRAFSIKLSGIKPAGSKPSTWSHVSIETLRECLSAEHQELKVNILDDLDGDCFYKADLMLHRTVWIEPFGPNEDKVESVAKILAKKGVALKTT